MAVIRPPVCPASRTSAGWPTARALLVRAERSPASPRPLGPTASAYVCTRSVRGASRPRCNTWLGGLAWGAAAEARDAESLVPGTTRTGRTRRTVPDLTLGLAGRGGKGGGLRQRRTRAPDRPASPTPARQTSTPTVSGGWWRSGDSALELVQRAWREGSADGHALLVGVTRWMRSSGSGSALRPAHSRVHGAPRGGHPGDAGQNCDGNRVRHGRARRGLRPAGPSAVLAADILAWRDTGVRPELVGRLPRSTRRSIQG